MRHIATIVLPVLLMAAPELRAQQPDTVRLPPVVVTATRVPTRMSALSATVTVLDGEALRSEGIRDVAEALRRVPGVAVVRNGSYGALTSLFVRGGEGNYVKVLVDGVPLNAPGGAVDLADLTTDNVDRIEVVRGPASVLYGSDAVAGVIQIFTRRGHGRLRGSARVRGGSYGSLAADAEVSGGLEAVRYGVGVARSTTDGILAFNSAYDRLVLSGSVQARPDAGTEATVSVRYTDGEFHFPTDGAGNLVDENAFQTQERFMGALDVGRFLTDRLEARVLLTLHDADGGQDDRPDGPADTLGFFAFRSREQVKRRGADARLNLHLGRGQVVTLGAALERQREQSSNESDSEFGPSTGALTADRVNRGYYVQVHARPAPGLAVTAGARVDDNDAFGTFFTYRAGATYAFARGPRLRASVGKAFKEPTFFENFTEGPFARGNPELVPERTTSWEVGAEHELARGRARLAVTYFSQRFRDLIQFTFAPPAPGAPNYFNVPAADASGIELEGAAHPLPPLRVTASLTHLVTLVRDAGFAAGPAAEFLEGGRLLRRPTTQYAVGVSYALPARARFTTNVRHVGARADVDFALFRRDTLPAYTAVDVAAEVDLVRGRGGRRFAGILVRVENVFDVRYEEVFHFRAPGRAVMVGGRVGL